MKRFSLSYSIIVIVFISIISNSCSLKYNKHHITTTPVSTKINAERIVIENGIVLLVSEQHSLPVVSLSMIIKAGAIYDPEDKAGLANLTAVLIDEGTKKRSSTQISEEIDFIGGSIHISSGMDYSNASLKILKKDIDTGFELLSDILINPTFPEEELERKRSEILGGIIAENDEPGVVARKAFNKIVFGNHPYHRPVNGLKDTIPGITRDDIVSFYNRYYLPNNTIIAIVGDITRDEAVAIVKKYFGAWKKKEIKYPVIPETLSLDNKKVKIIDKDLTQANIILGHTGISRKNPDFYSIVVMNYILGGGGFSSRLTTNIRDNKGLAYSIYSMFRASSYPGSFYISLQTKNESANEAIEEIFKEIKNIRESLVSDEEISDAKAFLTGSFPLRLDSTSKIAGLLPYIEYYGLGMDYFERYPELINGVTREDILRVAKKYINPDKYALVVVAKQDKAKIKDQGAERRI
ncbi:MAG: M16 family metallopeptidase [Nitrospirota bacterium]